MSEFLLTCGECGRPFFTEGEKRFYESRGLSNPKRCAQCREISRNLRALALHETSQNWNIEAKQESVDYFFNTDEATRLLCGDKYFVIGRKGTGKTAIAEFIAKQTGDEHFAQKLSFKNFPFNYLYSLENNKYSAPNQYITIWKYLIYSCICKMMTKNRNVDKGIAGKLRKLYPDSETSLARMVESWTATDFGVEVLGVGLNGRRETTQPKEFSWIEKCDMLEDIIAEYADDSRYYVIIDELDEDYREFESSEERETYLKLLVSLFKAVQDVRAIFKGKNRRVYPIIFLRTDIYTLLKDSDKNKWRSFRIDMDWTEEKIKDMLAHRISVACGAEPMTFSEAWAVLFDRDDVEMGNRNATRMGKFEYITRSTHLRPRDYIQYLIECSNEALARDSSVITSPIIKAVDDMFSDYLRDEIIDEAYSVMPDINVIFEILSQIRKQIFSPNEFVEIYNSYVQSGRLRDQGSDTVLRMLFEFGVIGNLPTASRQAIFKYQAVMARFNHRENIMIHRGLYKALQIY